MNDVAPRQLTATFTPVNGITQHVTKDEVLEKLALKEQETKMTKEQEVLQMLKDKGINLDTVVAALSTPSVPGVAQPVLTPGQRIGQGVGKLLRISKLAVQVAKVQSKAFVADVKKGYQDSK